MHCMYVIVNVRRVHCTESPLHCQELTKRTNLGPIGECKDPYIEYCTVHNYYVLICELCGGLFPYYVQNVLSHVYFTKFTT